MPALYKNAAVGVIGAGTMGAGIAQVASAAGHPVVLFDAVDGAARHGLDSVASGLNKLTERGKMNRAEADGIVDRITIAGAIGDMRDCALVVEAIVEDLGVKQQVFSELEAITAPDAILATNTSSISVTAIGAALERPERLVGMHFFNPAPIMKLVEVISGLATDDDVADAVFETAKEWGKVPARAKSTPGFIVNRVARPYYGEALRLLEEGVADAATIDALFTGAGGFRMGPFELMDLIGNDVNYAVTESVFAAFHQDPRYRPSQTQAELVAAGRLGRKSGRGFYDYQDGAEKPEPSSLPAAEAGASNDTLIALTDGRTANQRAMAEERPVIVYDLVYEDGPRKRIGFAASSDVSHDAINSFVAAAQSDGMNVTALDDTPGLVVMRTVAMLANEAFEVVHQGVADAESVDAAMQFGVNYPLGPLAWAERIGVRHVLGVIDALFDLYRDQRYRASLGMRRAAGVA